MMKTVPSVYTGLAQKNLTFSNDTENKSGVVKTPHPEESIDKSLEV
jgi:hypothetical protein